jgi:hypothetical protein
MDFAYRSRDGPRSGYIWGNVWGWTENTTPPAYDPDATTQQGVKVPYFPPLHIHKGKLTDASAESHPHGFCPGGRPLCEKRENKLEEGKAKRTANKECQTKIAEERFKVPESAKFRREKKIRCPHYLWRK